LPSFVLLQFNMVCANTYQGTVTKVVFTVGLVVGAILIGSLADR